MEAGRVIGGRYRLRREIGKGAMGSVWAAVHESLGRAVAVKFLRPSALSSEAASARFVSEARMAAMVKHRFVVDIFDFGLTEDGVSYMVLELLEGEELGERMYHGPPMLVSDAVRFVVQCLSGLAAVHDAGIVHRDLKPENIFIMQDADGVFPKLLDFGISKLSHGQTVGYSLRPPRMGGGRQAQLTLPGTVIGTPWYMAPEQLRGTRDIDARADIYGMGVILWEWITGHVPHDNDNIGDLILNVLNEGPPDLREIRADLGEELAAVLRKAMAVDRNTRFQSAQEMRDALRYSVCGLPDAWTKVQREMEKGSAEMIAIEHVTVPPLPTSEALVLTSRLLSSGEEIPAEVVDMQSLSAVQTQEITHPEVEASTALSSVRPAHRLQRGGWFKWGGLGALVPLLWLVMVSPTGYTSEEKPGDPRGATGEGRAVSSVVNRMGAATREPEVDAAMDAGVEVTAVDAGESEPQEQVAPQPLQSPAPARPTPQAEPHTGAQRLIRDLDF